MLKNLTIVLEPPAHIKMLQSPPWAMLDNSNRHGIKRKTDLIPEEVLATSPPVKRFVSEEEMALEMRRLHIEANAFVPTAPFVPMTDFQSVPGASMSPFVFNGSKFTGFGEEDKIPEVDMEPVKDSPRLFISEEVAKIKIEPLLPPAILAASLPNCMALVPYVPRPIPKPVEDDGVDEKTDKKVTVVEEEMELM